MEENKPKNNPQDAIHEQQLNNSLTDKTIVPTAETSDIINPHSEIIDMEVHHHAHDPVAPHHKKNWKSYFWEFLMLFLAVFCGFLAENKREHMVEHKRAKAYAKSLYKDLQNDTADIKKAALYENRVNNIIDSLVNLISSADLSQKGGQLYYYMRIASLRYDVDWNKATLNQLISSGNLRYFTNTQLVTQLSNYNTIAYIITRQDDYIFEKRKRAVAYKDRIAIPKYEQALSSITMDDVVLGRKNALIDSIRNTNMPMQNNAADMLNAFTNAILDTKGNRQNQRTKYYPRAIELANEIMDLLKKEYQLK